MNKTANKDVVIHDDIRDQHRIYLEEMFIYLPDAVQAILIAGNMLVLIIAFCGNIAAFIIIAKAKLSKTRTKLFLATLAFCDLLLVISVIPIEMGKLTDKYLSWVFGTFLCETVAAVQTHAAMMNAVCLFGIALDRYLSVIRLPKLPKIRWTCCGIRISSCVLVFTWIFPFAASLPMLWAYEEWSFWVVMIENGTLVRPDNETHYLCQIRTDFPLRGELWGILGATYFLLILGFILCYASIIKFVKNRGVNFSKSDPQSSSSYSNNNVRTTGENNSSSGSSDSPQTASSGLAVPKHQHRRTVQLIMTLILVYTVCRTPVMVFNLVYNIKQTRKTVANTSLMYFLHLLSNINAAISPFLYAIWNNSLKSAPPGGLASRQMKSSKTRNCCWSRTARMRPGSRTFFTNTSGSGTNVFKTRQNSFSFNTQSKIYPSSSPTPKSNGSDKQELVLHGETVGSDSSFGASVDNAAKSCESMNAITNNQTVISCPD